MEKESFEEFKRELIQRNDLVSIASKYVQLERKGSYFWCRCPFHGEKTPSLCIYDIDNTFYCYGCHAGGNVISFVMQIESLSFMEAVKLLAENCNMELPSSLEGSSGANIAEAKKRKDRLIALLKDTARHYHENLYKPAAAGALEYLNKRQLPENVIKHFGLGFSNGFNELPEFLASKGYTREEMLATGVVKSKDNRVYDPQAGRVIFPIINIYGEVIAFGGRTLDPHPDFAKYLNTGETELFNKRNTLYAINYLKKQRQAGPIPFVIVVEGYMDTISLHKAGFTMTVASMGTSLTQNQAKLIKRFSDKVFICYDGDSAGQNATLRGLDILKDNGLDVMVVQLPDKFDPDDVIKTYGKEGYQKILNESLPLTEFKIKYLKSKFDLSLVDGRVKFLNSAIDVLATVQSSVERELYIPMVSEIAQTNIQFIKSEIERKVSGKQTSGEVNAAKLNKPITKNKLASDDGLQNHVVSKAEKYVLCALIHEKPYAYFKTDVTYLFSEKYREIFKLIMQCKNDGNPGSLPQKVLNSFDEENQSLVADIINYGAKSAESQESEKKYYEDCLWLLYKKYLEECVAELSQNYTDTADLNKRAEIGKQMIEIQDKLKRKMVDDL